MAGNIFSVLHLLSLFLSPTLALVVERFRGESAFHYQEIYGRACSCQSPKPSVSESISSSLSVVTSTSTDPTISSSAQSLTLSSSTSTSTSSTTPNQACPYWLEDIQHRGISALNPDSSYQVFRNVRDFGAKGDGIADDTAAINAAISSGDRCGPGVCNGSTITPAVVYVPPGTYLVSSPIVDFYHTQLIGNPNCLPTIKASSTFMASYIIDGDPYMGGPNKAWLSTSVFWRQIRNFVIDTTLVPSNQGISAIHWPTGQATSLQNIVFQLSAAPDTQHDGLFIEEGSGGFVTDLIFYGGNIAANMGNQQFTMRNLTFYNSITAIKQIWDWGWTYHGISINNCNIGLDISGSTNGFHSVGSVTFIDSSISNTSIGISTTQDSTTEAGTLSSPSLILENVVFSNVEIAVQGPTQVSGSTGTIVISAFGEGNVYSLSGETTIQGAIDAASRPASLLSGDVYYSRSKPQYEDISSSAFVSVRDYGATGDGQTDDTDALGNALSDAKAGNKVLFVDAGTYKVSQTICIPSGSRIVGESYSVILASGDGIWSDINNPNPVVQVGEPGENGTVEWSDMIVSTQGAQPGAILVEWNLAAPADSPAGMWDVHSRIGGFTGSQLQVSQCPTDPTIVAQTQGVNENCIAAFASMHITESAAGIYMENVWLWTADHDVDDPELSQITIYAGRGLLVESTNGPIWMYGTAVEHHTLYQYQLVGASNIFMGQIQTETAYYQPNPPVPMPFTTVESWEDPIFQSDQLSGWGLRVVNSTNILVYGADFYSFFSNNNVTCSNQGNGESCQTRIFSTEESSEINVYALNTVGTMSMWTNDGIDEACFSDNLDGFVDTIAMIQV